MVTIKNLLIDFFNLCFPPDNESQKPKTYELILFYSFLLFAIIIGFTLLR